MKITTSSAHDRALVDHLVGVAKRENRADWSNANSARVTCRAEQCGREFRDLAALQDHAEAVHTFDDIRRMVRDAVADKYNVEGDYRATPVLPGTWTYVEDLATDWVVFFKETGSDSSLFKSSYSITDGVVTLGEPVEVTRRTVYEAVSSAPAV